jgi:hypothetical protein
MHEYQEIDSKELEQKFRDISWWTKIHAGTLLEKIQSERPAKIIQDGISRIVTYYDEHLQYFCTMHQVVTREGNIIHEDIKDAVLEGIWYKTIK